MTLGDPPRLERRVVRVTPPPACDASRIRAIRRGLNVSQGVFAELLNVSLTTVQAWEQGKRVPDGATLRLLEIAQRSPGEVLAALSPAPKRFTPTRVGTTGTLS